jgi:hypothetical protein
MNSDKCPNCKVYLRDCLCCLECGALDGHCECGLEEEDDDIDTTELISQSRLDRYIATEDDDPDPSEI